MKFVKTSLRKSCLTLWLNRPEVRNAFNPEMIKEITEVFSAQALASEVRCVVLRGEGPSFCAGADLEWMKSMVQYSLSENEQDADQLFAMFKAISELPRPVIGVVHGHVMGGGLGLVAACDFAVAESHTQFCFSEVKIGLVPAVISSFVRQKMHPARAAQMMMSAQAFSAEQAWQWGLVSHCGEATSNEEQCQTLVDLFTDKLAPEAVAETKRLLLSLAESKESGQTRARCVSVIAERRTSPEGQEGLRAFLERRPPQWQRAHE